MTTTLTRVFRVVAAAALAALVAGVALPACGVRDRSLPEDTAEPDKWLYDRGQRDLNDKKWFRAREYFRKLIDSYPQSTFRPDAKLALGDTFLGENTAESLVFAENEFREFLTFYPTSPRADYAQYQLGLVHFKQMPKPGRDQTQTKLAIVEFETFLERYPKSPVLPEAQARLREARDRLDESDYGVGLYYYRAKWYPGAIDRFRALLKEDPEFTKRDAVYFYLADALTKTDRGAEALPYLERLVKEFENSEFLPRAQKLIAELKAALEPGLAPPA